MMASSTKGRAASWKSTRASSEAAARVSMARNVDSVRLSPPLMTARTLANGRAIAAAASSWPGAITTMTSSMSGVASKASME
jgi:hypothetical protein